MASERASEQVKRTPHSHPCPFLKILTDKYMLFPTTQLVADTVLPTLEWLEPSMGRHKMGTKAKGTRNHAKIILSFQKGLGRGVDHIGVITQPCAIPEWGLHAGPSSPFCTFASQLVFAILLVAD